MNDCARKTLIPLGVKVKSKSRKEEIGNKGESLEPGTLQQQKKGCLGLMGQETDHSFSHFCSCMKQERKKSSRTQHGLWEILSKSSSLLQADSDVKRHLDALRHAGGLNESTPESRFFP